MGSTRAAVEVLVQGAGGMLVLNLKGIGSEYGNEESAAEPETGELGREDVTAGHTGVLIYHSFLIRDLPCYIRYSN